MWITGLTLRGEGSKSRYNTVWSESTGSLLRIQCSKCCVCTYKATKYSVNKTAKKMSIYLVTADERGWNPCEPSIKIGEKLCNFNSNVVKRHSFEKSSDWEIIVLFPFFSHLHNHVYTHRLKNTVQEVSHPPSPSSTCILISNARVGGRPRGLQCKLYGVQ